MKRISCVKVFWMQVLAGMLFTGIAFGDMSVNETGQVGIGNSNPTALLHVGDATGSPNFRLDKGDSGTGYIEFNRGATRDWYMGVNNSTVFQLVGEKQNEDLEIWINDGGTSTKVFRINSSAPSASFPSGKVGIGTESPQYKLQVTSSGPTIFGETTGSSVYAGYFYGATHGLIGQGGQHGIVSNISAASGGCSLLAYGKPGGYGVYTTGESYNVFSGSVTCLGKLNLSGGFDPPYVLYDFETRESIIERVLKEIPPDKLDGAVQFFNGKTSQMEIFLPSKGEFRSIQGEVLESVNPITYTYEVKDRYYLDSQTGEIKTYQVRKVPEEKYKIKADHSLDPETGAFYQIIKDENGVETERVSVTKAQAVERVFQ